MNVVGMQNEVALLPQVMPDVVHRFADGCYSREVTMLKGCLGVGALHKTNHHFILSKGKILVKNGNVDEILVAPHHSITRPGDKRSIFAMEDSVITTFHVTELTDVEAIGELILGEEL